MAIPGERVGRAGGPASIAPADEAEAAAGSEGNGAEAPAAEGFACRALSQGFSGIT